MKKIIENVVSKTMKEYINENFSRPSILKENDGDDMGNLSVDKIIIKNNRK